MATAARVTVAATAVALNAASTAGQRLLIVNTDSTAANAADLGGPDVTAGAGAPLAGGASLTVELAPGDVLYAIRSTANSPVLAVLRT
jgi:hypothetical protein